MEKYVVLLFSFLSHQNCSSDYWKSTNFHLQWFWQKNVTDFYKNVRSFVRVKWVKIEWMTDKIEITVQDDVGKKKWDRG